MDFKQLEIFIKIVELKSFSRAAQAVYLTQPTATSHIQSLEKELGIKLLDRLAREVIPTAGGKLLYKDAKRLIAIKDEAKQNIDQFMGKMVGRVVVGGSTIPGEYLLPAIIGKFRKKYPGITVSVAIGDTSEIAEKVLSGECEMGLIGSQIKDGKLEHEEFFQDELVLIAGPQYPIPSNKKMGVEEIASAPFVIRGRGSGSRMTMEKWCSEVGLVSSNLNVVAEMGSTEAVKQAVKAGLGLAIVSSLAIAEDLRHKALTVIPFQKKKLYRNFYIISCRSRSMSPVCRAFSQFLRKC